MHFGRSWIALGISPNHTPAKKTALQKKLQCKKTCILVVAGFRSGPPQTTPLQKKLRCEKNCNAEKTAMQKKMHFGGSWIFP